MLVEVGIARSSSLSKRKLLFIMVSQEFFAFIGALVFEAQCCGFCSNAFEHRLWYHAIQ